MATATLATGSLAVAKYPLAKDGGCNDLRYIKLFSRKNLTLVPYTFNQIQPASTSTSSSTLIAHPFPIPWTKLLHSAEAVARLTRRIIVMRISCSFTTSRRSPMQKSAEKTNCGGRCHPTLTIPANHKSSSYTLDRQQAFSFHPNSIPRAF